MIDPQYGRYRALKMGLSKCGNLYWLEENDGFRQPGYALAAGPGITYSYGRDTLIAEMPIVFNRHINPGATLLPGLPVRGGPAAFNANRQMGLVAPLSLSLRYVRSF